VYEIKEKLVVAIASSALFDLTESDKVFRERGEEAYRAHQREREDAVLAPGVALSFIRRLLSLNAQGERPVEVVLLSVPRIHVLDRLLVQSGIELSVAAFLLVSLGFYGVGVAALVVAGLPTVLAAAIAAPFVLLPLVYVLNQRMKRIHKIEEQLPDALDLIGRALRAGHAFQGALHMVANEAPEPVSGEFKTAFDEINFGVSVQEALMNMATRVPSTDLRYFVIAVMIQRDTGGNLAELLDNISRLMRDRIKLLGTVRVLAAEGKLSAWILSLLPFALAMAMTVINPGFLNILFTDPLGQRLLLGAGMLMLTGIIWLWRLTKIHV